LIVAEQVDEVGHVLIPDVRGQWTDRDEIQFVEVDGVGAVDATLPGPQDDLPGLLVDKCRCPSNTFWSDSANAISSRSNLSISSIGYLMADTVDRESPLYFFRVIGHRRSAVVRRGIVTGRR
jgi:hypothetical protein